MENTARNSTAQNSHSIAIFGQQNTQNTQNTQNAHQGTITLRSHQESALSNIASARKNGEDSYLVVRAPSMGKTLIGALDIKSFRDEKLRLGEHPRFLILNGSREILLTLRSEFFRVFGDSVTYGNYWSGDHYEGRPDFVFATFASIYKNLKSFQKNEFTYLLIDEAHHSMARTHQAVIDYFDCDFRLGLTATPVRSDGKQIAEKFGTIRDAIELPEALAAGEVAPVDYLLMLDDCSPLAEILEEKGIHFSVSELNKRIFAPKRDEEIVRSIQERTRKKKNPKTIIFCPSIEHANRISNLMAGSTVVHSRIDAKECTSRLEAFKRGDFRTIVSVDKLNEGIDIPSADVIVFLRSTVSQIIYYQQLGRGLRTHKGKDSVLVLDFVANCERLLMIEGLRNKYLEASRSIQHTSTHRHPHEKSKYFQLNIPTPAFRSRYVDILEKINEARGYQKKIWTKEEIIAGIKKLSNELDRTPTEKEINNCAYLPAYSTIIHLFGSISILLSEAGISPGKPQKHWTKEEAISSIKRYMLEHNGKVPTKRELDECRYTPSARWFRDTFGSWDNTLIAIGLKPRQQWTEESAISSIKRYMLEHNGKVPTKREIDKYPYAPCSQLFKKFFGSWNNALIAAGLTPRKCYEHIKHK